jgi:alkylation response protein AidB-like acyl-CoA dehydrogenase
MGHYRSNLRDLEFNLFEVFERGAVLGAGPYADMDAGTARTVLAEVRRLAERELADSFADADRNPPVFDPATGTVTVPESLKRSYRALIDAEWFRLDLPVHLLGANPPAFLYMSGPGFASILHRLGTADQKRLARWIIERRWGVTMVLTEPDAGSDVGAGRTRAVRQPDGSWHLAGVKRFITSAEHDLADNVVHLVLARPEGHGPGTKGLSLFVVPKFTVDLETGELAGRNGVYATNLEKKMGIRASATCELAFGERHPAVGWLVGDTHDGIAQMFEVIEYARMMVGTKAISTLSTGYLNALEFAKQRVQGADLVHLADKTAPRVTILHHPDVRRLLLLQKAYAEGLRSLVIYTATVQDRIELAAAAGKHDELAERLNDLLLPLVKGFGSERAYEQLGGSLQVLGGSGYLQDYPMEQYVRDAKIDTLYEGTTAIQGMDLFFRKIVRDGGQALGALLEEVRDFGKGSRAGDPLALEREILSGALENVEAIVDAMVGFRRAAAADPRAVYRAGLNTTRLLMVLGDLVTAWLLLRGAAVALERSPGASPRDRDFYAGKVAAARFFARERLPLLGCERTAVEGTDLAPMDLAETAF